MDALIPCEQCRRHVDAEAAQCPHCGAAVRPEWREAERRATEEAFRHGPPPMPVYGPPPWALAGRDRWRRRMIAIVLVLAAAVAAFYLLK